MRYRMHNRGDFLRGNAKLTIAAVLVLCLSFCEAVVKADWKSDANARIESIRKRNAQITVHDSNGQPVPGVTVQIEQVKHRFGFGTAIPYGLLSSSSTYRTFVLDHFEWAVCENEMKWKSNEENRDVHTYTQPDYIATWCANNDIKLRGHCIAWEQNNSQMPEWLKTLSCAEMPAEVNERIDSIVGRYAGQIVSWDVDNEMLSDDFFGTCLGESGRANMFNRANAIDPNCGMYMNEYRGNSFGGYDGNEYVARAKSLINTYGAQVEGLGIQAHVASPFKPADYYNYVLNELDDVGLPIIATEFDTDAGSATQVADDLENFYRICFSHPNVEGIMMWGCEQSAWRWDGIVNSSTWVLTEAGVRYEALLDEWTTEDANTTNTQGNANFRGFHGTYEITLIKAGETNEIHEIELVPGTPTQSFILDTNFGGGQPDYNAPTPDPMTWFSVPTATGPYSITMTATTAADATPPVQYYFECTNHGEANSTWQTNTTYVAQGLNPSTLYTFKVKARDSANPQNVTGWSNTQSATTNPPDTTPPTPTPSWSSPPTATGPSTITMTATTATDATSPPVQYYFECTNHGEANSTWQTNTTYVATGLTPSTLYTFRVKARDSAPALNETGFSSTASATTQAPSTDVNIIGSWTTGTNHAKETGYSRALIFIAHAERTGAISLSSVKYGGQAMTKVIDMVVGTSYQAYVAAFILNEANIVDANSSGTFEPNWSGTPDSGQVAYASVFLSSVDQTTPVGATASNSSTTATVTTNALSTGDGDMVIDAATCGNGGTGDLYTVNSGFTEALEHDMTSCTGVDGYKSATGANETPSVTHDNANRQVLIGFVVKAAAQVDLPPAEPTGLSATAGNQMVSLDWDDNNELDLAGYNVYRSTIQGGDYDKLNVSLVGDSNYIDNTVTNGIPYYYVVKAVDDANNESGYSDEASATPDYQNCADVQAGGDGLLSDLSGDCYVDYGDLAILTDYWLNSNCGELDNCEGADFVPTDGVVDFFDFADFAIQWMHCNDPEDPDCTQNW